MFVKGKDIRERFCKMFTIFFFSVVFPGRYIHHVDFHIRFLQNLQNHTKGKANEYIPIATLDINMNVKNAWGWVSIAMRGHQ